MFFGDDRARHQVQASGLTRLRLFLLASNLPVPAEHEPPAQVVELLALVELAADAPPVGFALQVAQRVNGLRESAVLFQEARQPILTWILLQFADEQGGGHVPHFQAPGHAKQFIPSVTEYRQIHLPGEAPLEVRVALEVVAEPVEPRGPEVADAR